MEQATTSWLVKEGLAAGRLWLSRRQRMSWADAAISDIRRTGNLALSRGNYAKVSDVEEWRWWWGFWSGIESGWVGDGNRGQTEGEEIVVIRMADEREASTILNG